MSLEKRLLRRKQLLLLKKLQLRRKEELKLNQLLKRKFKLKQMSRMMKNLNLMNLALTVKKAVTNPLEMNLQETNPILVTKMKMLKIILVNHQRRLM